MWTDLQTSFFLARKSIVRGSRVILVLTPLIIALSIANLIFSAALFEGMVTSLNNQLIDNLFSHIVIEPAEDRPYIMSADDLLPRLNNIPGVLGAAAHYKAGGAFSFDPDKDNLHMKRGSYQIIGVQPEIEQQVTDIAKVIIEGRYLEADDRDDIVIGAEVAGGGRGVFEKISLGGERGINVGEKIRVVYGNDKSREYTVRGIFKSGIDGIDMMTFVTRKEMESVLGVSNMAHEILVRLNETGHEQDAIDKIRRAGLTKEKISSWNDLSSFAGTMTSSFDFLNLINGAVSLIIACATIFIVIFINVINKRRQLGILKAIGVSEKLIIHSFIMQALCYGAIGGALSAAFIYGIVGPYFARNPLDMGFAAVSLSIDIWVVIKSTALIVGAGLVAGYIPAWFTTRQSIIKAIWG